VRQDVLRSSLTAKELSSVSSGTLYLESIDGKVIPLRPFEELRFSNFEGFIRSLTLQKGELKLISNTGDVPRFVSGESEITLTLHGRANSVTIGPGTMPRELTPTLLEWLATRHSIWLLWGGAVSTIGVIFALLRWLRVEQ
jgi:hypothetical protein